MITPESIETLKTRLDIIDVVGSYVELKKAGANYKAPCPFHDEKTASFVVSPQKQIYHCFGCGAGGDSIKFTMEYEKLNYPEALEKLADSNNFTLSYTDNKHQTPKSKVIEKLQEYYTHLLPLHVDATKYLNGRSIYESSIEKFGIGYAPDSNSTLSFIISNQFNLKEAVTLGVVGFDGGRNFARFIERITFPIHSANGSIVGFGGRTISGHQAKYVNSPETPIFNKSRLLYAYHHAKQALYKQQELIITEGYLDVVMLHQAGFTNSVATLGTALTQEHIPLLRKGNPKIIMAYDGDNAGRKAGLKASKLLSASGFNGGVVIFGDGVDPADMVANGRENELAEMFRSPKAFIEFVLDEILSLYDLRDPKAKEACMQEGTSYLRTLSPLLQEEYKTYLVSRLGGMGVSPSLIKVDYSQNAIIETNIERGVRDLWELSLVKTVAEKPHFINIVLDMLDPSLLMFHSIEFQMAINADLTQPAIMAILIDETIVTIESEEALHVELSFFLRKHYEREIKKLNIMQEISFKEKIFKIRSLRGKIEDLKRV